MIMLDNQRNEKSDIMTSSLHKIAICVVSIMLIYNYYHRTTPIIIRVADPKFSALEPHNNTKIITGDIYEQLIDIKNFSFKINPQPCKGYDEGILLVVIVSSNPRNYDNRMAIRSTWGHNVDSTKVVFLIGELENKTFEHKILNESAVFGDIVQGSFVDAYRNMTYKHIMGLKWIVHHCPTAKYILKTDDDVLVHTKALRSFLVRELSPWGAKNLITCQVLERAMAQRNKNSKWLVSTDEYAFQYYPTYCAGWVILYSQDVVPRLLKAAQVAPYFWIDDVQITGVLAQQIGVPRTPLNSLILNQYRSGLLTKMGPKYAGPFIFGPPDLSVQTILKIWQAIPDE